jgi:ubiquinone/menaquinone biosynthesis C-methylase UbiE
MSRNYGDDSKSALQAKSDAQKIAFAPIMFQAAKALRDLKILSFLRRKKEGASVQEIAEHAKISEYGALVLLEAGLSLEMVMVEEDKYFLTKTGYFVSVDQLTRVNMDFSHDVNYKAFYHLQESVKEGKPSGLHHEFGTWPTVYEALAEMSDEFRESWFGFDHYYSDTSFPQVMPIIFKNAPKKIMDVGGNTGKFALLCAGYREDVNVTILDHPDQIANARNQIEEQGLSQRIKGEAMDLLDHTRPFPKGADVIWMSQFLDCFSKEDIGELLRRSYEAMNDDSALFILELFWDMQKFEASTYSLHATSLYFTNMANGCSQMYHSEDLLELIQEAGMVVEESFQDIGVSHTLFKCRKKR